MIARTLYAVTILALLASLTLAMLDMGRAVSVGLLIAACVSGPASAVFFALEWRAMTGGFQGGRRAGRRGESQSAEPYDGSNP